MSTKTSFIFISYHSLLFSLTTCLNWTMCLISLKEDAYMHVVCPFCNIDHENRDIRSNLFIWSMVKVLCVKIGQLRWTGRSFFPYLFLSHVCDHELQIFYSPWKNFQLKPLANHLIRLLNLSICHLLSVKFIRMVGYITLYKCYFNLEKLFDFYQDFKLSLENCL